MTCSPWPSTPSGCSSMPACRGSRRPLRSDCLQEEEVPGVLAGETALVTGASSGIGRATAVALAGAGARVAVVARRAERLKELAGQIEAEGGEGLVPPADVTDEDEAAGAVVDTVDRFGGLDILVHAAGMTPVARLSNSALPARRTIAQLHSLAPSTPPSP